MAQMPLIFPLERTAGARQSKGSWELTAALWLAGAAVALLTLLLFLQSPIAGILCLPGLAISILTFSPQARIPSRRGHS